MKYFLEGAKACLQGKAHWIGDALYRGQAQSQWYAGYDLAKSSPNEIRKVIQLLSLL